MSASKQKSFKIEKLEERIAPCSMGSILGCSGGSGSIGSTINGAVNNVTGTVNGLLNGATCGTGNLLNASVSTQIGAGTCAGSGGLGVTASVSL
jgi:hypothetical protein